MNNRKLVLFLILFGLLWGAGVWLKGKEASTPAQTLQKTLLPGTLSLEALEEVSFSLKLPEETKVTLRRSEPGGWQVEGAYSAPADLERLKRFIAALSGVTGEERARGEAYFKDFGLGEAALWVSLREEGRPPRVLALGRSLRNPSSTFLWIQGEEGIYAVEESLLAIAGFWGTPSPDQLAPHRWADMRLFPVAAVQVEQIQLLEWSESSGDWVSRFEGKVPSKTVGSQLLGQGVNLRATALADPKLAQAEFKPAWRWQFQAQGGRSILVEEGAASQESSTVALRRPDDNLYFLASLPAFQNYREQLLALAGETVEQPRPASAPPDDSRNK